LARETGDEAKLSINGNPNGNFDSLDKNGDGKLTDSEIPDALKEQISISKLDRNHDNAIDKDEWPKNSEEGPERPVGDKGALPATRGADAGGGE
jgi:hypothetical protein